MSEPLVIRPVPTGGKWVLHPPVDRAGDRRVAVLRMEMQGYGLRWSTQVELSLPRDGSDPDLIVFFQGLADDWRGWTGTRTWRSPDGKLRIDAVHDGAGHVAMAAAIAGGSTEPDAWPAGVMLTIEAGEQMRQLIDDLRILFEPVAHG